MITIIQKLAGCHKGSCARMWRGEWTTFDFEKPFDKLYWNAINRWEWLQGTPGRIAWTIADHLCRLAARLRKHRRHEGWYGINCNEAEILSQNIQNHLIPFFDDDGKLERIVLDPEDADSMRENLDRLAALARATYWHDT